jgi:uncharacterized membrane protein YdjX (TVP38/TMEM64 family)
VRIFANKAVTAKILVGISLLIVLAAGYWFLRGSAFLALMTNDSALQDWIEGLGIMGPIAVIGLMTLAILASPIPSAPIAVAAGAAYGHLWGTGYVLLGAELGAVGAFGIARLAGHDLMRRLFGDRLSVGMFRSQTNLMALVFVSRLMPFVSFDIVSYAAGLTILSFWRFAVATFAGIIPASFFLAHLGSELKTGEIDSILISVFLIGGITLIPILLKLVRDRSHRSSKR